MSQDPVLPSRSISRYGWRPGLPDFRNYQYEQHLGLVGAPPKVDLRSSDSSVYDQGSLGSCTSQAIAGMCQFLTIKFKRKWIFTPSRLFIYYNERAIEGTIASDSGAAISDGLKTLHKQGACNENRWPYIISKFRTKPTPDCYDGGLRHRTNAYYQLDNTRIDLLKSCLAEGYPFVYGFTVFSSFESSAVASTGIVPMPRPNEGQVGGHAVMAVGYDDAKQWFIVRNSWGRNWGDRGYFYMPYSYITSRSLADDFWTIRDFGGE